jgi:hypothetical protein
MNLTRYSRREKVPARCTDSCWLITSGNEFSDMKSATIEINEMVALGIPINTISVGIYGINDTSPACYYVVAQPL